MLQEQGAEEMDDDARPAHLIRHFLFLQFLMGK